MGRRNTVALVAGAAFSLASAGEIAAQAPAVPDTAGGPRIAPQMRPAVREHWRAMSPEDRQHFKSNVQRWLAMPPEERRAFREREGVRRERLQREAEAAAKESGLQLEAERREQYERRYMQERRRIDRALREELQEKRRRELAPVVERLKSEFGHGQGTTSPSTSSVPAVSPGK